MYELIAERNVRKWGGVGDHGHWGFVLETYIVSLSSLLPPPPRTDRQRERELICHTLLLPLPRYLISVLPQVQRNGTCWPWIEISFMLSFFRAQGHTDNKLTAPLCHDSIDAAFSLRYNFSFWEQISASQESGGKEHISKRERFVPRVWFFSLFAILFSEPIHNERHWVI